MISVPGREVLQAMKRVDIQRLCKEYGVKANLKTEALIELLLHASQPHPSRSTPAQPPPQSTPVIIASQLQARPRGRSNGSIVIHDIDEEEAEVVEEMESEEHKSPPLTSSIPRTRKAKDTQYRLGVGRPTIAGGSGARAVTKSVNVSRGSKRSKSTRNVKQSEETIVEEVEPEPEQIPADEKSSEQEGSSGILPMSSMPLQTQTEVATESLPSHVVECAVAAALAPVQKELEAQKAQLSELADKVSGIIETFETRIRGLTAEIEYLRSQASGHGAETIVPEKQKATPQRIPIPPSTPKRVRSPVDSLGTRDSYSGKPDSSATSSDSLNPNGLLGSQEPETDNPNQAGLLLPGFRTTLGKRPRDSNASTATTFFELGQELELSETEIAKRIARPAQKRAKIGSSDTVEDMGESSDPSSGAQGSQTNPGPSRPRFSMFGASGLPDFVDLPPPTESLADVYAPPSPPLMSVPSTSTIGDPQNPFQFTFLPTSTPAHVVFPTTMGTFPRPEPPTSPSPANNVDRPGSRQSERFGFFGQQRSSSGTTRRSMSGGPIPGGQESAVNPSIWSGSLQRQPSSNEVASGLGLTVLRTTAMEEGSPAPPAVRTMYGTELESDTRFGDFGVEGVANGFWASGTH